MSHLEKICGTENPNRRGDVIFVHGLNGDARTTWHPEDQPERFWPSWIGEDLSNVGTWSVSYPAKAFAWQGSTMPLADRAVEILVLLHTHHIGTDRPVMFITHSMGGLLVKEMLRKATDGSVRESEGLAHNTCGVVFLSTPHSGADLANFVDFFKVLQPNDNVQELQPNEPRLRELNTWYRNNVGRLRIETQVYCERRPTRAGEGWFRERFEAIVVDANCADPGIPGVTAVPMDDDHITISRPERSSMLYLRIRDFVNDYLISFGDVRVLHEEDGYELPYPHQPNQPQTPRPVERLNPESLNYPDCPQRCQKEIMKPGGLLRIKAPRRMGKTFLLNRVLDDAQSLNYRIAKVNLWKANIDTRRDLDKLLQWLCEQVCLELGLPVDVSNEWQSTAPSNPNSKCTDFFSNYFLNHSLPLVLGLDSLDLVFDYPKVADDFLGLIRGWHEDNNETWQQLRIIIVHMQHYETTIIDHSPLNVGEEITLPDLTLLQIQNLVVEYGLSWNDQDIHRLTDLVGGHPLLIRLGLRYISNGDYTLASLLKSAHTAAGVYFNYLESHLRYLKSNEDLAVIMREVISSVTPARSYDYCAYSTRKLSEVGLIEFENDDVIPANQLLRLYLRDRL